MVSQHRNSTFGTPGEADAPDREVDDRDTVLMDVDRARGFHESVARIAGSVSDDYRCRDTAFARAALGRLGCGNQLDHCANRRGNNLAAHHVQRWGLGISPIEGLVVFW